MTTKRKWTTEQIVQARQTPIKPVLEKLGYQLFELYQDNWSIHDISDAIVIKHHYWRDPEKQIGGNAIDLLIHLGHTFNETMDILLMHTD